jgi:hypothetical protein
MDREQLVEKMRQAAEDAWFASVRSNPACIGEWAKVAEAALDVALDAILAPPDTKEWGDAAYSEESDYVRERDGKCFLDAASVGRLLASRRSRLTKHKSPEERVTLVQNKIGVWWVYFDGERKPSFAFGEQSDAEIYRLGLIQQLKEKP